MNDYLERKRRLLKYEAFNCISDPGLVVVGCAEHAHQRSSVRIFPMTDDLLLVWPGQLGKALEHAIQCIRLLAHVRFSQGKSVEVLFAPINSTKRW